MDKLRVNLVCICSLMQQLGLKDLQSCLALLKGLKGFCTNFRIDKQFFNLLKVLLGSAVGTVLIFLLVACISAIVGFKYRGIIRKKKQCLMRKDVPRNQLPTPSIQQQEF